MSDYQKCPICKNWGWLGSHTCPPAYGVRMDDWDPEEEVEVRGDSPEEAATNFVAERFADFEYPTCSTVIVNDWRANHSAGKLYRYEVNVEAVPSFSASLTDDQPEQQEQEEE